MAMHSTYGGSLEPCFLRSRTFSSQDVPQSMILRVMGHVTETWCVIEVNGVVKAMSMREGAGAEGADDEAAPEPAGQIHGHAGEDDRGQLHPALPAPACLGGSL